MVLKRHKLQAESVWRVVALVRIEDESEREHLQNAIFIEGENEDPKISIDVFTNIELQDNYNGTVPFLTCVGDGWR